MPREDKENLIVPTSEDPSNRDSKGRFAPGYHGGPGRKARPESIKKLAEEAPERLREMANNPTTKDPIRADIYKWAYEIVYGKAKQAVDATVDAGENTLAALNKVSLDEKLKAIEELTEK